MSNYSWLIGGGIGWFLLGPLGAVIGGIIGSAVGKTPRGEGSPRGSFWSKAADFNRRTYQQSRKQDTNRSTGQGDMVLSFLALFAEVIKADAKVRASEVQLVKKFLVQSYGKNRAVGLMQILKKLLKSSYNLDDVCYQIRLEMEPNYKLQVIQLLFQVAVADDELLEVEVSTIRNLAKKIGVQISQFDSIRSMFQQRAEHSGDFSYRILGLKKTATPAEIKSTYRKLVKENHPDKAGHLGKEFRELAERKFKEINGAYQKIKKERGFK